MLHPRPSSAWRHGFLLYDGWPAQEGGTDSRYNQRRSTHSLLQPAESCLNAAAQITGPADEKSVPWEARYPAWWTKADAAPSSRDATAESSRESSERAPARPLAGSPSPPVYEAIHAASSLAANDASAAAAVAPPSTGPSVQRGPPSPRVCSSSVQTQTRTTRTASRLFRTSTMPCQRKKPPAALPPSEVTSVVGSQLRRQAALNKQLAAARRRRLAAIVAGADPAEAPLVTIPRERVTRSRQGSLGRHGGAEASGADTACGDDVCSPQLSPMRVAEASTATDAADVTDPPKGAPESNDAAMAGEPACSTGGGARPYEAPDEVQSALDVAQHFLGSTLGQHFVSAASHAGRGPPPPSFCITEGVGGARERAATNLGMAPPTAAGATAAMCVMGAATVGSRGSGDGEMAGLEQPLCLTSPASAAAATSRWLEGEGEGTEGAAPRAPRALSEVCAAVHRFGLHVTADETERRQRAREAALGAAASFGAAPPDGCASSAEGACAMSRLARPRAAPATPTIVAWEIDISELRGDAPSKAAAEEEEEEVRRAEPLDHPRGSSRARGRQPRQPARSHAGWVGEFDF